ncbi:hypothetical protein ACFYYB_17825 [Streptomyces sp. NPDC002886]|uniref:hypothetical protein n=1 Tax=Streptomyces sp. NPDC002886 TaxID=3364667 RepID=UPI00368D5AAE
MRARRSGAVRGAALAASAVLALSSCGGTEIGTQNNCSTGADCAGHDVNGADQGKGAGNDDAAPPSTPSTPSAPEQSSPPASPPSPSPSVPSAPSSSSVPPAKPKPKPAPTPKVRWQGPLLLYSNGAPGGWWLDRVPPSGAGVGDLGLSCDCHAGEVEGHALVAWEGAKPPGYRDCSAVKGLLAGRSLVARTGGMACLMTLEGRLGYFTVTKVSGPSEFEVAVTVWDAG